jgi:hypothetical protein
MSQIFTIQDDKVVIKKLSLNSLEGNVSHSGDLHVDGAVDIAGVLTVDTLKVKNLETETGINTTFGEWTESNEADLLGKGISWSWGHGNVRLGYMTGNRLWTNSNFDLAPEKSYMIDGTTVLSATELSSQITKSRLREVGTLKTLAVTGDVALAEFATFNSSLNRLGLNTDEPNGTLSIVDNNTEFLIASPRDGVVELGTYTNSDLQIVTDNTTRIVIKSGGEVVFGNPSTNNADVKIYGKLHVETIVSDNRIDRYNSLEFKTSKDWGVFGQGLMWTGTGNTKSLLLKSTPDRLSTTESFEIDVDQSFYIGGQEVLSAVALGKTVTSSALSRVGTLEELTVDGEAMFMSHINASRASITAHTITFNQGSEFTITNSKLSSNKSISFDVNNDETYYADQNEIIVGNKNNTRRPVKLFGQVSIGVNNPNDDVNFEVKGDVRFADKKFTTGTAVPTTGSYSKGDICWNSTPTPDNYIGWVCIEEGAPGRWLPFGAISRQ